MKTLTQSMSVALLGMSLAIPLTACDSRAEPDASVTKPYRVAQATPKCYDCGTITNVEQMTVKGTGTGLGNVG